MKKKKKRGGLEHGNACLYVLRSYIEYGSGVVWRERGWGGFFVLVNTKLTAIRLKCYACSYL